MDPTLFREEHNDLRAAVRRYVERELEPNADQWEADRWFPNEVFTGLGEVGYLGLRYPEELGGEGGDVLHEAVFFEEMQRCGSGGLASGVGTHVGIATPPIWKFGDEEQQHAYVVPALKGEKIGALAITEPSGGSDVAAIRTRADRVDGGWLINGEKTYITNGARADFLVTVARTTPEGGHNGLSFFIVEKGEGVTASKLDKLGWHASDTATVAYEDAFVPENRLLGPENDAFKLIMANFQWERLLLSLQAIGTMQAGWERTLDYVRERRTFGKPLTGHQVIRHEMADLATSLHSCRCITYDALRRFHAGLDASQEVTMAKLVTQRAAVDFLDTCLQLHGGAGYMTEYKIERMYRDARVGPIGGGSDQIMREVLGRTLGL